MTNIEFLNRHNYNNQKTEREAFDFILYLSKVEKPYKYITKRAKQILISNNIIYLEFEYKEKGIILLDMVNYLHKIEKGINDREYKVFINKINCVSNLDISIILSTNKERVRQIESSLIKKLKHPRFLNEFKSTIIQS
ncbi:MAG: hypothetical protein M0Q94_15275 [Candidatus Cloacimonetes bacterium]|nr:hypothetical protein [Candidatus Cloacimonadota bacterium]